MADTTFTNRQTSITAAWAQDVNDATYKKKNVSAVGRIDVFSRGILADGTDQTAAMVSLLSSLENDGWRGFLYISYGTKFNVTTVYAAVPVGITLVDESSVNVGHTPGGTQKMRVVHSGDSASDDFVSMISSGHNTARGFLNFGTAGTTSASGYFMTEFYAIGVNYENDFITTLFRQHKKSESAAKWQMSHRVQTPYAVAVKDPQLWAASTAYATGDYCISDSGKVYLATTGGTSGSAAISGTSTSITDGSCVWSYKFPAINIDSTFREEDEDGDVRHYGVSSLTSLLTHSWTLGSQSASLAIGATIGTQIDGMLSLPWHQISGATPSISSSYAYVNDASPTALTDFVLPTNQVNGFLVCFFATSNTTVTAGSGITLKAAAASVNPSAGSFMTFVKFNSHSSAWIEFSRSF